MANMKEQPANEVARYDPSHLLEEITGFLAEAGISETTFGFRAVNDTQVIGRVRSGGVTLKTVKKLREYIAAERAKVA